MAKEATKELDRDGGKEAKQERHEGAGHATGGAVQDRQMQVQPNRDADRHAPAGPMFEDTEHHNDPIDERTGLRGRPESPSDRPGQRTRDNVNPNIPSAPPGEGGIVDPASLGMEQGGKSVEYDPPVRSVNEPATPAEPSPKDPSTKTGPSTQEGGAQWPYVGVDPAHPLNVPVSPNEPPGSDVTPDIDEGGGGTPGAVTLTGVTPSTGVIGADVPITAAGTGFTEASVISFGGTALETTYGSATSLTATAPGVAAAEGPVDVTVDGSAAVPFTWTLVSDDPDVMEAELEDAEDDGDYTTSRKSKSKGKR